LFTGIVQAIGCITATSGDDERRLVIDTAGLSIAGWQVGDSVAVAGVCLTVAALAGGRFEADLSGETLRCTTLGALAAGSRVNLEPALPASGLLGGHLVTGHVDGVARVQSTGESAGSLSAVIEAPAECARYIAGKGSVALDGVSLTVGEVNGREFSVHVVPHTRRATTLGALEAGQVLNLEVDLVARYIERLLAARGRP
jgi:riboflavin synthase